MARGRTHRQPDQQPAFQQQSLPEPVLVSS
jgi:hypothetical protein